MSTQRESNKTPRLRRKDYIGHPQTQAEMDQILIDRAGIPTIHGISFNPDPSGKVKVILGKLVGIINASLAPSNLIGGIMIIKNRGRFHLLVTYLYRVFTRTGPHGKGCKCPKWGWYVTGCPIPSKVLVASLEGAGFRYGKDGIAYFDNVKFRGRFQPETGLDQENPPQDGSGVTKV